MFEMKKGPMDEISKNFVSSNAKETKKDRFYFMNKKKGKVKCRNLYASEIEILVKNNNFAEDWNEILVTDQFDPNLVKNCEFYGRVTIGKLNHVYLEYHDLKLPVGISNSTILSCDIGDNVVIKDVHYLSHYQINNNCILFNIDEMITTNHAKFGNGILKEGEDESLRIWLEICNENEGRKVLPFESMIPADAYIWSKFRDDKKLMNKFESITEKTYDKGKGYYGVIGKNSIVKNCKIIKDVNVGECAYIKGANKLKNLTILSSKDEPSQIGEGVELVNGIMGYGSKIFYGCKAVRFITGRNTQLKYGARLINSILGDNSTISCCELLNNLIFPFHEQHHNTSFLISTTIKGQSNIAAGATIGSNHNSRSPDGEIVAGRGFWPGLCTDFKHNCKFASFVLIAKGSYQYEMNIKYPFSLVSIDNKENIVSIMPAYWFMHNMYAMARNTYKFKKRDKRINKIQNIEFESLAPDTMSEIIDAINRLEFLIKESGVNDEKAVLYDPESVKKSGAKIIKPIKALEAYKEICIYYFIRSMIDYFNLNENITFDNLNKKILNLNKSYIYKKWENIGGQIIPENELNNLKDDIKNNKLSSWEDIHKQYDILWKMYPEQKARYSLYILEKIKNKKIDDFSKNDWINIFNNGIKIVNKICDSSIASRKKDYTDPFRKMTYSNDEEMTAVLGKISDNTFLNDLKIQTKKFVSILNKLLL